MSIIISLTLILCGCFACYPTIQAKQPELASNLDKVAPYKHWIGLFALVWGVISVVSLLGAIAAIGIWWMIGMLAALCLAALGFLFSYDMLQQNLFKGTLEVKAAAFKDRITAQSITIGYAAIVLGVLSLLSVFF